MAENSAIGWTDHTFNPWEGCQNVSPGCDHCYAETRNIRFADGVNWGPKAPRRRTSAANWRKPVKWNADAAKAGRNDLVFCASLADVFDNAVPKEWREDLWALIRATPNLTWQLLTKRPQNIKKMLPDDWGNGYPNVWLGTTVEDQKRADERIPVLLAVPAVLRFLSCEPLLGPVDVYGGDPDPRLGGVTAGRGLSLVQFWEADGSGPFPGIDWVICGGESGPGARPMHPVWARSLRDQCAAADVPFFFKQWGEWARHKINAGDNLRGAVAAGRVMIVHPTGQTIDEVSLATGGRSTIPGSLYMARVGKKAAGAVLDGVEHKAMPEVAA